MKPPTHEIVAATPASASVDGTARRRNDWRKNRSASDPTSATGNSASAIREVVAITTIPTIVRTASVPAMYGTLDSALCMRRAASAATTGIDINRKTALWLRLTNSPIG